MSKSFGRFGRGLRPVARTNARGAAVQTQTQGRGSMGTGCLVATCTAPAVEHVTVIEGDLEMRFAVCVEHCYDIRWNALEPTTARDRMRSLISLA